MEKIKAFQITDMTLSGFKSFSTETHVTFGSPTVITGGNGRGKSSLADAIAFAVTGLPFGGERKLDRLHSDDNPDLHICMHFIDENNHLHELVRTRNKNRMNITYDGYEIRQLDLTDMFGERDVFLSMFNPLYFIEELGDDGKQLLERYLPLVPQETVMEQLSDPTQKALNGLALLSPEGYIKQLREDIREMESTITYLQGQQDLADSQRQNHVKVILELSTQIELLRSQQKTLKEKQFAGMNISAMQEELMNLSARYSELLGDLRSNTQNSGTRLLELNRKLGERKASVYEPRFVGPITETTTKVRELALQYKKETTRYAAIIPGYQCPTCHRSVSEADIPTMQAAFRASIDAIVAEGHEKKAQLKELEEMEHKSRATFEQFKA